MPEPKEIEVNEIQLSISEVLDDAVIVVVDGWRIRLYFNDKMKKEEKEKFRKGSKVVAKYTGELKNIHSVKFLKL